jgi:hypothetical protein
MDGWNVVSSDTNPAIAMTDKEKINALANLVFALLVFYEHAEWQRMYGHEPNPAEWAVFQQTLKDIREKTERLMRDD